MRRLCSPAHPWRWLAAAPAGTAAARGAEPRRRAPPRPPPAAAKDRRSPQRAGHDVRRSPPEGSIPPAPCRSALCGRVSAAPRARVVAGPAAYQGQDGADGADRSGAEDLVDLRYIPVLDLNVEVGVVEAVEADFKALVPLWRDGSLDHGGSVQLGTALSHRHVRVARAGHVDAGQASRAHQSDLEQAGRVGRYGSGRCRSSGAGQNAPAGDVIARACQPKRRHRPCRFAGRRGGDDPRQRRGSYRGGDQRRRRDIQHDDGQGCLRRAIQRQDSVQRTPPACPPPPARARPPHTPYARPAAVPVVDV